MSAFPCRAPWDGAVIHFSGAVYPCNNITQGPEMAEMRLGSLKDDSLEQILNGPKARKLRRRLLDNDIEGLLCAQCDKAQTCNPYGDPSFGQEGALIHGGAKLQSRLPGLDPMPFKRLELGLTDLCNMNCIMCCLSWGEASPKDEPQKGMMDKALLDDLFEQISVLPSEDLVVWLHWIGEPLIYPHVDELCQRIDDLGATLHLVTNGIQLTPKRQQLLLGLNGRHTLNVSLNALTEEVFAEVNQSNAHGRVMRHTHGFLQRTLSVGRWNVVLSAVVLKENWEDVIHMVAYWSNQIEQLGAVPSIVINGKPDPNRQITAHQIALLREVSKPEAVVYFREVLRACLPDVDGWDLDFWHAYDQALIEGDAAEVVQILERMPQAHRNEAAVILQALSANDPKFAAEVIGQGDVTLIPLLLEPLNIAHERFEVSIPTLDWNQLSPIDCLRIGLSFLSVRKQAFQMLEEPTVWTEELRLTLAHWLLFEPELNPELCPNIEPTERVSDILIAFWQGQSGLCIPEIHDAYWLEGFAAQISIHDRPKWNVQVLEQPLPVLSARLLEAIDPQHHTECFVLNHELTSAPSWLWRAFRRRIIFAGLVGSLQFDLKLGQLNNQTEWEKWLVMLCGTETSKLTDVWCGGIFSETAYSDLADVLAQIDLDAEAKKLLAFGAEQILMCPLLSLSMDHAFGLVRLWAMSDEQGGWEAPAIQLMDLTLQDWQMHELQLLLTARNTQAH